MEDPREQVGDGRTFAVTLCDGKEYKFPVIDVNIYPALEVKPSLARDGRPEVRDVEPEIEYPEPWPGTEALVDALRALKPTPDAAAKLEVLRLALAVHNPDVDANALLDVEDYDRIRGKMTPLDSVTDFMASAEWGRFALYATGLVPLPPEVDPYTLAKVLSFLEYAGRIPSRAQYVERARAISGR